MLIIESNKFLLRLKLPHSELTIGFYNHITKTILPHSNSNIFFEFERIKKSINHYTIRKFFNKYYAYGK